MFRLYNPLQFSKHLSQSEDKTINNVKVNEAINFDLEQRFKMLFL